MNTSASSTISLSLDDMVAAMPPAKKRPVQWRRLWQQLAILNDSDPAKVLDAAFSVGDALGGMSEERLVQRILTDSSAREFIAEKSSLVDALADRETLSAMAEDSLGHHFFRFCQQHGIQPRKLIESQHDMSRDYKSLDPLRQYLSDRFTVMHDLWHVLAGYDATTAGESALMCFSLAQRINDRALPIFITMSACTGKLSFGNTIEAIKRGRQSTFLPAKHFESLLPLPLQEVRQRLAISPPQLAHPGKNTTGMLIPLPAT